GRLPKASHVANFLHGRGWDHLSRNSIWHRPWRVHVHSPRARVGHAALQFSGWFSAGCLIRRGACTTMSLTMTDAAASSSKNGAGAGDMLWGFWYPALRSDQIHARKLVRAMLLEVPLVLGRDAAGKPFALRDVCPHRAFPLSFGQFDGTNVECAYHGWQFDAHTGQCRHIPSLTADSKLKCERIYAGSFPCEERDGYIWAFMANPEGRAVTEAEQTRAGDPRAKAPEGTERVSVGLKP